MVPVSVGALPAPTGPSPPRKSPPMLTLPMGPAEEMNPLKLERRPPATLPAMVTLPMPITGLDARATEVGGRRGEGDAHAFKRGGGEVDARDLIGE
jgi:hypothetical protein